MAVLDWLVSDAGQRLIQNLIAVVAIVLAARGVRNWNRERRDLRRAELAEQSLAIAYKARDAISSVRSPFGFSAEGSTRPREANEPPEQQARRDSDYTPIERLNHIRSLFDEMQTLKYNVTAAFGVNAAEPFSEFFKVRNEILIAARMRYQLNERPSSLAGVSTEERDERYEEVIWEVRTPDAIVTRLDSVVARLEATFRPYVEARFRPFR